MWGNNVGHVDGLLEKHTESSSQYRLIRIWWERGTSLSLLRRRDYTIVLQMGHVDRLGVGLNKVTGTRCGPQRYNRSCLTLLYNGCLLHKGRLNPAANSGLGWKHGYGGFVCKNSIARTALGCTIWGWLAHCRGYRELGTTCNEPRSDLR